jgi:ferredoxin, 2Fe-2S
VSFRKLEKVKVVILNLNRQEIAVEDQEKSLIANFAAAGQDWMQACGQKGRCTTCAFEVIEGQEFLSEESEAELKFRANGRLKDGRRLACQTRTSGNIVIRVPDDVKLPHLTYTEL